MLRRKVALKEIVTVINQLELGIGTRREGIKHAKNSTYISHSRTHTRARTHTFCKSLTPWLH